MGLTESSVTTRKSPIFKRTREYFSIRKNNSKIQQSTSVSFSTTSDFGFEDRSRCFSNPENERFNVGCTNNQSAFVGRSRRSSKSSRQNSPGMKEPQLSMHHPQPSVKDCHYTCHPHCRSLVTLDCRGESESEAKEAGKETELEPVEHVVGLAEITDPRLEPLLQEVSSQEDAGTSLEVSREQLQFLIEEYNAGNTSGLDMTLEEDGSTFRGFIRVHMNLYRPISVAAGTRPPSIYDILKEDDTFDARKTLTSFYLPRDTVKALHVTSETTTHEVIKALLKKFKVVDNPQKFALYERYYEEGETAKVKMRLIGENEKPLVLALRWSREQNCNKMFVLQENETGDILWDAFSLPELNNFLRILDREEEEYKKVVREKYKFLRKKIEESMERFRPLQMEDLKGKRGS